MRAADGGGPGAGGAVGKGDLMAEYRGLLDYAPLHKLARFENPGVTIYGDDHGEVHAVSDTVLADMPATQIVETFTDLGVVHIKAGEVLELAVPVEHVRAEGTPRPVMLKITPVIREYGFAYGVRVRAGFVKVYDWSVWVVVDAPSARRGGEVAL